MKKNYVEMTAKMLEIELETAILAGSKTMTCIKVEDVMVEPFRQGFGNDETDDFQNVSFD